MTTKDPFVTEVARIIRERRPDLHGPKTVILVSGRFHRAAKKELKRMNAQLLGDVVTKARILVFRGVEVLPVSWLSDYEFEIRPPV